MSELKQIGTVEILRERTYWLDGDCLEPTREGIVPPGIYPLYSDGHRYFWMLTGELSVGSFQRMGDGMFVVTPGDVKSGLTVTFPSKSFGPNDFKELCEHPTATEGHIEQRLRIKVYE